MFGRRDLLRAVAVGSVALAGCSGGSSTDPPEGTDIAAAPGGSPVFDPDALTVSVGDTVTWFFAESSHNVSCVPADSSQCSLPEGAEPFASYETDKYDTEPSGATYEHTFETAGEYHYVCIPHASVGMVGTITVEK